MYGWIIDIEVEFELKIDTGIDRSRCYILGVNQDIIPALGVRGMVLMGI